MTTTQTYNAAGQRTRSNVDGALTTYSYDAANRLRRKEDADGITTFAFDQGADAYRPMQLAQIADETWLGNFEACGAPRLGAPARVIHVWHETQPGHCARAGGLAVEYREHDPFRADELQAVWDYSQEPGELLIHCAAGIGRSATLAIVVLAARGVDPFDAMGRVAQAMWTQYSIPYCPAYDSKRINEIMQWLARTRG